MARRRAAFALGYAAILAYAAYAICGYLDVAERWLWAAISGQAIGAAMAGGALFYLTGAAATLSTDQARPYSVKAQIFFALPSVMFTALCARLLLGGEPNRWDVALGWLGGAGLGCLAVLMGSAVIAHSGGENGLGDGKDP